MSDKCAGCFNKFKRFEKPHVCSDCHRNFCSICLPGGEHGKKSKKQKHAEEEMRDTCVYCSRKQKQVNMKEEAEILEHFQERFYKHAHTEPPVQTRVQLDMEKSKPPEIGGVARAEPQLSEKDRLLEERFRRLKESHKSDVHTSSEDEIKDRLAKLRDEEQSGSGAGASGMSAGPPAKTTQFEQARDLMKEATEEVRLDEGLAEMKQQKEEDLRNRFQALTGRESATAGHPVSETIGKSDSEIQQFLEDMEIEITEEDPEALLQDLREYQRKEEGHVFAELRASGIPSLSAASNEMEQSGTDKIDLQSGEASDTTPYPKLPSEALPRDGSVEEEQAEIAKLIWETEGEITADKRREEKNQDFLQEASERLAELRAEERAETGGTSFGDESDCVVRSKPKERLSFTWGHFGTPRGSDTGAGLMSSAARASAARELGITASGEPYGERERDIDDGVKLLLEQMMAEAALEEKLEAGGYGDYLDNEKPSSSDKGGSEGEKGASAVATGGYTSWGKGEDEFPWCCICNNDAVLRCQECDGDLYCQRCFSEGHEQFGLFDHHFTLYEPPANRDT